MRVLDVHPVSRGLSYWNGRKWCGGEEAFGACRLDPAGVCSDVWEKMSLEPLPRGRGKARHRAEVAVAALREAGVSSEGLWIGLTPAGWEREEMQVFLGVARECGLHMRWLVPRAAAVAAATGMEGEEVCTVLEWSWNSLYALEVRRDGEDQWRVEEARRVPDGGIFHFFQRESALAQYLTLERRRMDPLDSGATEQALFASWWSRIHGKGDWVYTANGGAPLNFREDEDRFRALHGGISAAAGVEDDAGVIAPAGLRELLGWSRCRVEPGEFQVELADHGESGACWREAVPAGEGGAAEVEEWVEPPPRVTHVLIEGVAEPWKGEAAVGELVELPDGRRGVAICVRVPHGAPA